MRTGMATQTARTAAEGRPTETEATPELQAKIALRAYQIFEESGRVDGHDMENWLRAEQEVLSDDSI